MSDAPSWLQEDTGAGTVKENPVSKKTNAPKDSPKKKSTTPPPPPASAPAPAAPAKRTGDIEQASVATADKSGEFHIEEETLKQMQKWHIALRISYMVASVLMCAAAVLSFQSQDDLGKLFFAIYVMFFSALICCFEVALNVRMHCILPCN